jgi:23S rRNA (adenine2503-C2)-methyltransferase
MSMAEMESWAERSGLPAYRGRQIFSWIGRGATCFGEMTDIPAALRGELERGRGAAAGERARAGATAGTDAAPDSSTGAAAGAGECAGAAAFAGGTGAVAGEGAAAFAGGGTGAATYSGTGAAAGERMSAAAFAGGTGIPAIAGVYPSRRDETVKYAFRTWDGNIIESVLMKYRHGYTVCVSSQAGCRMGCAFCASAPAAFSRSLSPGEMLGQVAAIGRAAGVPVGHVVVMGIGEPFDNYDSTLKFAALLHEHGELGIGYRKLTISTCGHLPGIRRLAGEGLPIGLSVSLHAPNDAIRSSLMPINRKYSIDKLIEGCKIYTYATKRRITFEYALIGGKNDSPGNARELAGRLRGMLCHVNLIPVNRTERSGFEPPPGNAVAAFVGALRRGGIEATVRRELGADVMAACGQLRNSLPGGSPEGGRQAGGASGSIGAPGSGDSFGSSLGSNGSSGGASGSGHLSRSGGSPGSGRHAAATPLGDIL